MPEPIKAPETPAAQPPRETAAPANPSSKPTATGGPRAPDLELVPSLREVVEKAGLEAKKLSVAFATDDQERVRVSDKHVIPVTDAEKAAAWNVATLSDLFRGSGTPPADMDHYPPEYAPHFFFIEKHVVGLCDMMGDRPDQELEEIYSALRRRPEGRSVGVAHDVLWQVCALLLGQYVLSAAQFHALLGALERSTRGWGMRPVSRNYIAFLRSSFNE